EHRQILLLVSVEELSYREVADELEIPLGTVMSRLARARERLRELMQHETAEIISLPDRKRSPRTIHTRSETKKSTNKKKERSDTGPQQWRATHRQKNRNSQITAPCT